MRSGGNVRNRGRAARPLSSLVVVVAVMAFFGAAPAASAATDVGYEGPSWSGASFPPTSEKPQSKLWWHDGSWWAVMYIDPLGLRIQRWDRLNHVWVDTGPSVEARRNTLTDAFWDGSKLFIASHVATPSSDGSPRASRSNSPAYLYRYSFTGGRFVLDAGFPSQITTYSSEVLTIAEDSRGRIWATWTQVRSSGQSWTNSVYVNVSAAGGASWETPFVLPTGNANPSPDDIAAVASYPGHTAVMWTDQDSSAVRLALHDDAAAPMSGWQGRTVSAEPLVADDHLNLKSLDYGAGRIVAVTKTSFDAQPDKGKPQLLLHLYDVAADSFSSVPVARVADCVTRPQVILEPGRDMVHVAYTATSSGVSGCPYTGSSGSIWMKSASLANPSFPQGRGTVVMEDAGDPNLNNVTGTKQSVGPATGLLLLATQSATRRYWTADIPLGDVPTELAVSITATPQAGHAPLEVAFTGQTNGQPTGWTWDFGDGQTSSEAAPRHTYADSGVYRVSLTVSDAERSASTETTITVTTATPSAGEVTFRAASTASNGTASSLILPAPAATSGDVLLASVQVRGAPVVTPPAGWTVVRDAALGTTARLVTFVKVATASEPASYPFGLSRSNAAVGTVLAYAGVSTATPVPVSAVATSSVSSRVLTAPALTTGGPGLLVAFFATASETSVTPPGGMTERADANTGATTYRATLAAADEQLTTAGDTGTRQALAGTSSTSITQSLFLKPGS